MFHGNELLKVDGYGLGYKLDQIMETRVGTKTHLATDKVTVGCL